MCVSGQLLCNLVCTELHAYQPMYVVHKGLMLMAGLMVEVVHVVVEGDREIRIAL